jgi:hypothetical protein
MLNHYLDPKFDITDMKKFICNMEANTPVYAEEIVAQANLTLINNKSRPGVQENMPNCGLKAVDPWATCMFDNASVTALQKLYNCPKPAPTPVAAAK